jgi:ABC-type multidrug transport system, ATPase component
VLLMDEPTANLDPVFRDDFLKLLQEFVAEYEMTILLATHLDEDLSRVADYVIDIKNGEYSMREILE